MDLPPPGQVFVAEDGTVSTILDDPADPNYEPDEAELEEYAGWIGIEPHEKELMWIAREGLKTPLAKVCPEWKACQTDEGETYFFNFETGESEWTSPLDELFRDKVEAERSALLGKRSSSGSKAQQQQQQQQQKRSSGVAPKKKRRTASSSSAAAKKESSSSSSSSQNVGATTTTATPTALSNLLPPRLGSGGLNNKPDMSDILPPRDFSRDLLQQKHGGSLKLGGSGGLGGGGGGGGDSASNTPYKTGAALAEENERKLQEQLKSEFDNMFRAIELEHDKRIQEKESHLKKLRDGVQRDIDDDIRELVNQGERRSTQKSKSELFEFEDSLEKRETDLRRKQRQLQQQLDDEMNAAQRAESQISQERAKLEQEFAQNLLNKRQELQKTWFAEKGEHENRSSNQIRELQAANSKEISQLRESLENASTARLKDLDKQLLEQLRSARSTAQKRREEARLKIQQEQQKLQQEQQQNSTSAEVSEAQRKLQDAEKQRSSKVRGAQESADAAIAQSKAQAESRITDAQKQRELASSRAASSREEARQQRVASARQRAAQLVADARARNSERLASESRLISQEGERQVHEAESRAQKLQLERGMEQNELEARARREAEQQVRDEHASKISELRKTFRESSNTLRHHIDNMNREIMSKSFASMSVRGDPATIRKNLEEKYQAKLAAAKSDWLASHPAPSAPPPPPPSSSSSPNNNNKNNKKNNNDSVNENIATEIQVAISQLERVENGITDELISSLRSQLESDRDISLRRFETQQFARRDQIFAQLEEKWCRKLEDYQRGQQLREQQQEAAVAGNQEQEEEEEEEEEEGFEGNAVQQQDNNSNNNKQVLSQTSLEKIASEKSRLAHQLAEKSKAAAAAAAAISVQHHHHHQQHQQQQQQQYQQSVPATPNSSIHSDPHSSFPQQHNQQQPQYHHEPYSSSAAGSSSYYPPPHQQQQQQQQQATTSSYQSYPSSAPHTPNPHLHNHNQNSTPFSAAAGFSNHQPNQQQQQSTNNTHPFLSQQELQSLVTARQMVQTRKSEVKTRMVDLESARSEWKRDMQIAKKENDENMIRMLLVARGALEERARVLNEDAMAVKKAAQYVKQCEEEILYGRGVGASSSSAVSAVSAGGGGGVEGDEENNNNNNNHVSNNKQVDAQVFAALHSNTTPSTTATSSSSASAMKKKSSSSKHHHHHHHHRHSSTSAERGMSSASSSAMKRRSTSASRQSSTERWSNWLQVQQQENSARKPVEAQVQKVYEWLGDKH